jgi:hypothetical protein
MRQHNVVKKAAGGDSHLRDTSHCLAGLEGNFCDGAGVNMCHTGGRHSSGAAARLAYWRGPGGGPGLGPGGGPGLAANGLGLTPSVALDAMEAGGEVGGRAVTAGDGKG